MPLRKAKDLTHTLVAGLKDMISAGTLHPGSKLPPERELAKQFGVNRASVRQALKALDVMGIVHQRVGDGTYLTQDASKTLGVPLDFLILVDGISFQELIEARRIVEPELAARAAQRATSDDIAALEKAIEGMDHGIRAGGQELAESDLRFHQIIWRASGNRVCERMFSSIHRALSRSLTVTSMLRDEDAPLIAHERILDAVRRGDSEGARRCMAENLSMAETALMKAVPNSEPA